MSSRRHLLLVEDYDYDVDIGDADPNDNDQNDIDSYETTSTQV